MCYSKSKKAEDVPLPASDVEADPAAVARGDGVMSDEESLCPVQLPVVFDLINGDLDVLIVE
jgi:hypothetical protein